MPRFRYKAVTPAGQMVEGALEAPSRSALIDTTFTGVTSKTVHLGANDYTVVIGPFMQPGPPSATVAGSIGASVTVEPAKVPAPPALVLAAMGGGLLTMRLRRRRK